MKKYINSTLKRNYFTPEIEVIILDNEISLQLQSAPPAGPGETQNLNSPEFFNTKDPLWNA